MATYSSRYKTWCIWFYYLKISTIVNKKKQESMLTTFNVTPENRVVKVDWKKQETLFLKKPALEKMTGSECSTTSQA